MLPRRQPLTAERMVLSAKVMLSRVGAPSLPRAYMAHSTGLRKAVPLSIWYGPKLAYGQDRSAELCGFSALRGPPDSRMRMVIRGRHAA